jgi:hypothetical protein
MTPRYFLTLVIAPDSPCIVGTVAARSFDRPGSDPRFYGILASSFVWATAAYIVGRYREDQPSWDMRHPRAEGTNPSGN